jgi:hypothetical protein
MKISLGLHIWEGATADGEFNEIDSTTQVGTSPHYIDQFTTNNAISEQIGLQFSLKMLMEYFRTCLRRLRVIRQLLLVN